MEKRHEDITGYNVELCDTFPERFRCPLCKNLMREPIQTIRGELACSCCYENSRSNGNCPIDGDPISETEVFKDRHKRREIEQLLCFCSNKTYGCDWIGTVANVEEHLPTCKSQPLRCNFCDDVLGVGTANDHLKYSCTFLNRDSCLYCKAGCKFKPLNREELLKHLEEESLQHALLQSSAMEGIHSHNLELKEKLRTQELNNTETKLAFEGQMKALAAQITSLGKNVTSIQNGYHMIVSNLQETSGISHTARQANTDSLVQATTNQELFKDKIVACTKEVENLGAYVSKLSCNLSELDLRQELSQNASYDGKILWKIDNFNTRYQQAITGRVTALHSAPGFDGKYGYKFCARLYLNGDGMGKCTHMSLFFVVMKSEYDNLLEWPFGKKVIFKFINQEDQGKNVIESFYPDRNSSSFKKPTKEMNVAAGCPMFLPKEEMQNGGFIKDDCCFVEILVA